MNPHNTTYILVKAAPKFRYILMGVVIGFVLCAAVDTRKNSTLI